MKKYKVKNNKIVVTREITEDVNVNDIEKQITALNNDISAYQATLDDLTSKRDNLTALLSQIDV